MTNETITCSAVYRARGYDSSDELMLKEALLPIGPVRLRPQDMPEAGGSSELWLVISFVGLKILEGFIQHLSTPLYRKIETGLTEFSSNYQEKKGIEPEMSLCLSYDDVDLEIVPIGISRIGEIVKLADLVKTHLELAPLKNASVTKIVPGMTRDEEKWYEPMASGDVGDERFWGISVATHQAITHVYDTESRILAPLREQSGDCLRGHY